MIAGATAAGRALLTAADVEAQQVLLGVSEPCALQGRLTLTSGVAVPTSDVVGATTVYYASAGGDLLAVWNGTAMVGYRFTQLTLPLDANAAHTGYHQSGEIYDLFVINDTGTRRLVTGPKWSAGAVAGSATARGTGAGSTDIEVKSGILVRYVAEGLQGVLGAIDSDRRTQDRRQGKNGTLGKAGKGSGAT